MHFKNKKWVWFLTQILQLNSYRRGQYNIDGVSDYCLADETVNYCEVKKVLKAFLFDVG
jgi:hypothetical protein